MVKKLVLTLALVVSASTFTGCGLFSSTSDTKAKDEIAMENVSYINNEGVPFGFNRLVCSEKYIYRCDDNKLYRYDKGDADLSEGDKKEADKSSNNGENKAKPKNASTKVEVASVSDGHKILCPVICANKVYFLDYKQGDTPEESTAELVELDKTGEATVILENLKGVDRLYSNSNSIFLTVSQDGGNKYDLVKINSTDNSSSIITQGVIPNCLYVDKTQVYFETRNTDKVMLNSYINGSFTSVCEVSEGPFLVAGNFLYYLENYNYVDENWKSSTGYKDEKAKKEELAKQQADQEPETPEETPAETTADTIPEETTAKTTAEPKQEIPNVVLKKVSLLNSANVETVFDLAPVGIVTGCDNDIYFSHLKDGKFRGIIRFDYENRQVELPYSQEGEIVGMCVSNGKVYFTVDGNDAVYSINGENEKVSEFN